MNAIAFLAILIGLTFIIKGLITLIFPPKKINNFFGYTTPRSMKNIETWISAQKYSSKLQIIFGVLILILGPTGIIFNFSGNGFLISFSIIFLPTILLFILTENHLKKTFDKNGNRKS